MENLNIRQCWQDHSGLVLDSVNGFDVIECEKCQFKHIIPIPSPEELATYYEHDFYSIEKPQYFENCQEDLEWWNLVYKERYKTFEEFLLPHQRRILDIGSGPGFFLLLGKQRGWQTLGIEPSAQAAAFSRDLGLNIVNEFLDKNTADSLGRFNVVTIDTVLEHLINPAEILRIAFTLLNPGGLLYVVVANDYNPLQYAHRKVSGHIPWWVIPPEHINYFNFDSLKCLTVRCGFEVIQEEATFPIDLFLLMGDNYIGNHKLGQRCHEKRKIFEQNLETVGLGGLKRQLYQAFAAIGIGREVTILGKKPSGVITLAGTE